jgi:hypothetical protein
MHDLYPGYDVLAKWDSASWNEQTRAVVEERLAIEADEHRFFSDGEWLTLLALCERIAPQSRERSRPIPTAAMVDQKMHKNQTDGYRHAAMPPMGQAWRRGLAALEAEAATAHRARFHELPPDQQDALIEAMQEGDLRDPAWKGMPCRIFFQQRVLSDIVKSYYSHPTAWSEIGFGGPASPRGYVRMDFDRRDPWEAAEAKPGREGEAYRENRRVSR